MALLETAAPRAPKRQGLVSGHWLGRLTQALTDANRTDRSYVARVWTIFGVIWRKLVNMLTWEIVQRGRRWSVGARFRLLRVPARAWSAVAAVSAGAERTADL